MAKRKEDPPPAGCPAWTATFGDLNNLLLCFFVLLFSMSSMDAEKFEEIAASFSTAFGIFSGGESSFGQGALVGDGVSQLTQVSSYINSMGLSSEGDTSSNTTDSSSTTVQEEAEEEQLQASAELAAKVQEALDSSQVKNEVDVNYTSQYVQLTIQGSILFDSGSTDIKSEADPILDKVGAILESYAGGTIEIEGHTDNVPMKSAKYANNDELSDGRALSVFYYLVDNTTLDPAKIKHSGRGEYDPVADNSTAEGRARNRRVEIRIYNPLSTYY